MIRRRIFAVVVLFGFAIGSALFWSDGEVVPSVLGVNIAAAALGSVWLHYRWKKQEARALTPRKAEDIFS